MWKRRWTAGRVEDSGKGRKAASLDDAGSLLMRREGGRGGIA